VAELFKHVNERSVSSQTENFSTSCVIMNLMKFFAPWSCIKRLSIRLLDAWFPEYSKNF